MPGALELILVLLVILLLFGATRLPKLGRAVGESRREFKKGLVEAEPVEGPCPFCSTLVPAEARFCPGCSKSAEEIVARRRSDTATA